MALRNLLTATVEAEVVPVFVGDQRTALGHTVTYTVLIINIFQYAFYFAVQGCTTDDEVTKLVAEGLVQTLFYLASNDVLDSRHFPEELHHRAADLRQHFLLEDLLDDQRHRQNHERTHLGKGLHKRRWSRSLGQEIYLRTIANLIQELKHQSEHMGYRQHTQYAIAFLMRNTYTCKLYITAQVQICQHHALRITRRTGCVVDQCQLIKVVGRIAHMLRLYALRELLCKQRIYLIISFLSLVGSSDDAEVVHEDSCLELRHLRSIDLLAYVRTYIEQISLRVIHQAMYIFSGEIGQNADYYRAIGFYR